VAPHRLVLHTWTLDTTPLADVLGVARRVGWDAVELRRLDFARAAEAGRPAEAVLDLVRASGLPVACVGVEYGWMLAEGAERRRLLEAFAESCRWAAALGSPRVMSPVDRGAGDLRRAAASVREAGDLAAAHGVVLALEFNSQAEQFNTLDRLRELLALAGHRDCRLLLDTYHLHRSGGGPSSVAGLTAEEIGYVQYSDVRASAAEPGKTADRLPPGHGDVPFREIFARLAALGYAGDLSYEAPNPAAWSRDPEAVAREALDATRACLPEA
jgi:sugar phosphate isomerase/epimerase